jgi:AmmeMemoRadiSam system protein A
VNPSQHVSEEAARKLLRLARDTVTALVTRRPPPEPDASDPELALPAGAFVTIKMKGRLRGCIGNFEPAPLGEIIADMARAAAFEDPRFPPVTEAELPRLHFDLSILGPRFPITPEEVVVGVHGLFITLGRRRGVLLPQVPVEWGWDRLTYLDELCLKAGLPEGSWKLPECRLEAFTAQVIEEE